MKANFKRWLLAGIYAVAMVAMAAALTVVELRPKAYADTCPYTGDPCNLTNGVYVCTGGVNGNPPVPGCACDLGNFCIGDVR